MLRELVALFLARSSRLARRLGQDREAIAIAARHRRCHAAWAPHLSATRQFVLEAAAACPSHRTVQVLGSGLCLDIPVEALARQFAEVVLIDLHHPRPARQWAKTCPNVRLLEADVTGVGGLALDVARRQASLPRSVPIPDLRFEGEPDLTVSVNLASQLPIPLAKILGRRVDAATLETWERAVIEAHFEALARLPGRVCVVCDAVWERVEAGAVTAASDALAGARRPAPERTWIWDIAPRPEESFSHDRRNQIHAWLDFATAWRSGPGHQQNACPHHS